MDVEEFSNQSVVLVHGLWMTGVDMTPLALRLKKAGFRVFWFHYHSTSETLEEVALHLNAYLRRIPGQTLHLVAHSMGGLVVRRLFTDHPEQRPGRIVTIATPHLSSRIARTLGGQRWGRWVLGRAYRSLTEPLPPWDGCRELGAIAGDMPGLGLGRIVERLPGRSDGTVGINEALPANATDTIILEAGHMGLLLSAEAARQTVCFLRQGRFCR